MSFKANGSGDSGIESDCETTIEKSFVLKISSEKQIRVHLNAISDYETQQLPEFFDSRTKGKTEKSYLAIRNEFLALWNQQKPKRFGYHEVLRRVSHKHLGNVTAFSRVQKFLETHSAINEGSVRSRRFVEKTSSVVSSGRLVRTNPFKLVSPEVFSSESEAPFAVRLSLEALIIVDIHSHCLRTEVIGLLGGLFSRRELSVLVAEPCLSTRDSDLECDMDPLSQMRAKESIERKGLSIVGWYHSHPTFAPNPSIRDIETQQYFQELFHEENGKPFIALILSPYSRSLDNNPLVSRFKCLWNSKKGIPFELRTRVTREDQLLFRITRKVQTLHNNICSHASRVPLWTRAKRCGSVTCLEKVLFSLKHFLLLAGLSTIESDLVIESIRLIFNNKD